MEQQDTSGQMEQNTTILVIKNVSSFFFKRTVERKI